MDVRINTCTCTYELSLSCSYNGGNTLPSSASVDGNRLILTQSSESDSGNYTCTFRDTSFTFALMINPSPTTPAPTAFSKYYIILYTIIHEYMTLNDIYITVSLFI